MLIFGLVVKMDDLAKKWEWYFRCLKAAEKAKQSRDMKSWEHWSQIAALLLEELV